MGAFLAPILVVMVFNIVIFTWVCVVLIRHIRRVATQKKKNSEPKNYDTHHDQHRRCAVPFWSHLALFHPHLLCPWSSRNIPNSLYCVQLIARCLHFQFYSIHGRIQLLEGGLFKQNSEIVRPSDFIWNEHFIKARKLVQ